MSGAVDADQQRIVTAGPEEIVYTDVVSGIHANFLKATVPENFAAHHSPQGARRWKDIWSAGQGVGLARPRGSRHLQGALVRPLLVVLVLSGCVKTIPGGKAMEDNPIVQTGAAVLRAVAQDVPPERIATPEFQALLTHMVATMRAAPGVGLAAPQIGVPWRVLVLEDPEELMTSLTAQERAERERIPVPLRVFINPTLTPIGEEKVSFFEGCLSVAGFAGLVERFHEVEVTGLDGQGQTRTWRVKGWPARILQHEVDHLGGTLYLDRMNTRSFGTLPQVKARFGGKPIAQVKQELGMTK